MNYARERINRIYTLQRMEAKKAFANNGAVQPLVSKGHYSSRGQGILTYPGLRRGASFGASLTLLPPFLVGTAGVHLHPIFKEKRGQAVQDASVTVRLLQ